MSIRRQIVLVKTGTLLVVSKVAKSPIDSSRKPTKEIETILKKYDIHYIFTILV